MIKISNPEYQLRQNRQMWLFLGGVSSVGGLLIWSITPFAANNLKNPGDVWLRYAALIGSLGCGITAVMSGAELRKINPLIKAMDIAEEKDFISQLAATQYYQGKYWNQQALQAFQASVTPPTLPVSNLSPTETPTSQVNGSQDKQFSDSETVETSDSDTPDTSAIEAYKPLYKAVTKLKTAGTSDSEIIKELLGGNNGRTYDKAKQQLAALLQLGSEQGW